jgi:pimeloyl-ACP methyl ester carboxylesterase
MPYHARVKWVRRGLLALLLVLALGVAGVLASAQLALDRGRAHAARTAALPQLAPGQADGLVQIPANGMTFRARVAGLGGARPAVVLLHGFPQTSAMWEPLIDAAAAAGYRVLALDQRGYSPGARPEGVDAYALLELVGDVLAVADAAGFERFHLVGHDWGCVVGWVTAIQHPDRVLTWSGLSIPHPGTLLRDIARDPPLYIRINTAPLVPETLLTFNGMSRLRGIYARATPEQRDEYLAVFAEPGALTAALHWYRAIGASLGSGEAATGPVAVPTLFAYGSREFWVTEDALVRQRALVTGPYRERELDAGHFLLEERPDETVAAVLAHLAGEHERASEPGPP